MGTTEYVPGALNLVPDNHLTGFNFEASWHDQWVSLNDTTRFKVHGDALGSQQVTRRRVTVTSPFYDGEYEVGSVKENVKETVTLWVRAPSQSQLTEHLLLLEDIFSQSVYNLRKTLDEDREVWVCYSADYSIDRGHINLHNCMALFSAEVPRLPHVHHEVIF